VNSRQTRSILETGGRAAGFLASLYLNLGDAQASVGDVGAAAAAVQRAAHHLAVLPPGGYREFVALGIHRLAERVRAASDVDAATYPRTLAE